MAQQWMPVSPVPSRPASRASISSLGSASTASAGTVGSFAYVAPALRVQRNTTRVHRDIALAKNELVGAEMESAKHMGPRLPYFNLPFCLSKAKLNFLTSRFPRTTFRCSVDTMHDHPLAHAETMIACNQAQRMIPAGKRVIDLFGSPKSCDLLNAGQARANNPKVFQSYTALMTEKDYLRSLKWGDNVVDGFTRYFLGTGDFIQDLEVDVAGISFGGERIPGASLVWFLNHTIYYLSDLQIAEMLKPEGSSAVAILHRHPDESGTMFDGECAYVKKHNFLKQTNALTGESYTHRDFSFLWTSSTKVIRTTSGAFVWTFKMVSQDTWIVEITACPMHLDQRFRSREAAIGRGPAAHEMNEEAAKPSDLDFPVLRSLPKANCRMVGGIPLVSFPAVPDQLPIRVTCPELLDYLSIQQVGKPRDTDRLHDLFSLARSHISNGSDFPGKQNFKVAPRDIAGHVALAYISGIEEETDLLRSLEAYRVWTREHRALCDGAGVHVSDGALAPESTARSALSLLHRVNAGRKEKDTFDGILKALD
jgi:hypothetical protein